MRRWFGRKAWLYFFVAIAVAMAAPALVLAAAAPGSQPADLLGLIGQRLGLMPQVAAYKWHHQQPVEDAAREVVVIEEAGALALRHGLVPGTVERLFRAQIEAAKAVQAYWIAEWQAGRGAPPAAPDLAGSIRPALSRLGEDIVAAAAAVAPAPGVFERPAAVSIVPDPAVLAALPEIPGLDAGHRAALVEAVLGLRVFPHRLAQIIATGKLRIGTTGDYAPFSHRAEGEPDFSGIDIDLARDLAAALGVEAEFVLTSWPALLDDLQAGRYDVAMSGVSRTLARQRAGFLTQPYYADGKTPIARCADRERYASLERIDRPGVRVVVNPGGTNEKFVDERIRQASKVLHPDNRSIFGEILEGRADVMFTDRIEVELQTRRHAELCSTMATNLTYQEKSYLLPQDPAWLEFVDTWLALRLAEGVVDEVFAAHGFQRAGVR